MISQASSEQSICFAVKQADGKAAVRALSRRFAESINAGRVSKVCCVHVCLCMFVNAFFLLMEKRVARALLNPPPCCVCAVCLQVEALEGCCVLAAVGQGMVNTKGVSATMMGALAKANVNIKAIAQVSRLARKVLYCSRKLQCCIFSPPIFNSGNSILPSCL
jgi:aspartokinase/homoserine dehydrogenase 1